MPTDAVVHLIDDDEGVRHSLAFCPDDVRVCRPGL